MWYLLYQRCCDFGHANLYYCTTKDKEQIYSAKDKELYGPLLDEIILAGESYVIFGWNGHEHFLFEHISNYTKIRMIKLTITLLIIIS